MGQNKVNFIYNSLQYNGKMFIKYKKLKILILDCKLSGICQSNLDFSATLSIINDFKIAYLKEVVN